MPDTHCFPTGAALATSQLPTPNVPGYGGAMLPGTVDGVCIMFHSGITGGPALVPSLPVYQFYGGGLYNLAEALVADNWAVLWPSYPEEGQGSIDSIQAMINDLGSATSNSGTQLYTTLRQWFEHVLIYCGQQWPGKKIAVAGWSEGAFMACQMARYAGTRIIGGIAHEAATIWENVVASGSGGPFVFPSAPNYDLSATALNSVTVPMMIGYGTNDMTVGYDLAGTGGTPVSNTQAMIAAAGSNITANSTSDGHQITTGDATTYANFFANHLDGLR